MFLQRLGVLLILSLVSLCLKAAEIGIPIPISQPDTTWIDVNSQSGLITALPTVGSDRLIQEMNILQSDLQVRKTALSRKAEATEFTAKDGFITAVMPGGLLYAVIKKQQHQQAVARMNAVSLQMADLNEDLIEYRSSVAGAIIVAYSQ